MYHSFFFRRYLHVVLVEVGQVGIGICRRGKPFAFKLYFPEREDAVRAVHDAVTVVVERVRHVFAAASEQAQQCPYGAAEGEFGIEIEEFRHRPYRVAVRLGEYRLAS